MRRNESRVSAEKPQTLALIDASLVASAKAQDDFVFLRNDFGQIDPYSCDINSPPPGVSRVMRHLRAMHHGLRRRAANVDASSSQILFLDQRYGPAQVRESIREWIAGLARADNDGVIFHTTSLQHGVAQDSTSDATGLVRDGENARNPRINQFES